MIAQLDARGSEWCAVLTHILHQCHILVISTLRGIEIDDLCIAHVLGIADGTKELEVEGRGELEVESCFHAVVVFLQSIQRVVGKAVDVVEVEASPLRSVCDVIVVTADVSVQPAGEELVSDLRGKDVLVVQPSDEVIVHFRSHESY